MKVSTYLERTNQLSFFRRPRNVALCIFVISALAFFFCRRTLFPIVLSLGVGGGSNVLSRQLILLHISNHFEIPNFRPDRPEGGPCVESKVPHY